MDDRWESNRFTQPDDIRVSHGTTCVAYPRAVEVAGQHAEGGDAIFHLTIGREALPGAAAGFRVWKTLWSPRPGHPTTEGMTREPRGTAQKRPAAVRRAAIVGERGGFFGFPLGARASLPRQSRDPSPHGR